MGYYINTSLICATIIGTICFIIEAVALSADLQFNGYLKKIESHLKSNDSNSSHCLFFSRLDHGKKLELRRDSPLEPIVLLVLSITNLMCIASLVVTVRCSEKPNCITKLLLMNKISSCLITLLFFLSTVLLVLSIYTYDTKYLELNGSTPTGCSIGYHHRHKSETDCDLKYQICQKKVLKNVATILTLICTLLGVSAFRKELSETEEDATDDGGNVAQRVIEEEGANNNAVTSSAPDYKPINIAIQGRRPTLQRIRASGDILDT